MIYYGEQMCAARTQRGQACRNRAYFWPQLCGLHCRGNEQIMLPENPQPRQLELEEHRKSVEARAEFNRAMGRSARLALGQIRETWQIPLFTGVWNIFPEAHYEGSREGKCLPGLDPLFLDKGFYESFFGEGGAQQDWFFLNLEQETLVFTPLEMRRLYCRHYEELVLQREEFLFLRELQQSGYDLCLWGHHGFALSSAEDDVGSRLVGRFYDMSLPFSHEAVLFAMLLLRDFPWNAPEEDHSLPPKGCDLLYFDLG